VSASQHRTLSAEQWQREQAQAPTFDEGETLLVCSRTDTERLRVARKTFKGHTYFDIRVEFRPEGEERWFGTKKGVTIKPRELADVARALEKAANALADGGRHAR